MQELDAEQRARITTEIDSALHAGGPDLRALATEAPWRTRAPGVAGESWLYSAILEDTQAGRTRRARLAEIARRVAADYAPDLEVRRGKTGDGPLYLLRWWLERSQTPQGGQFGYYLHRFDHDDDAGLHDHPWPSASLLLTGELEETHGAGRRTIRAGDVCVRTAHFRHRLTLPRDHEGRPMAACTLIATGQRQKPWELQHADGEIEVLGGDGPQVANRTVRREIGGRSTWNI